MSPEIESALAKAERQRERYEGAQEAAEEALTQWFEAQFAELVKRYPKRRFRASSGMGSLSVDITPGTGTGSYNEYAWIWGLDDNGSHNPVLDPWFRQWQKLLDTVSDRAGLEYVNFTRDVIVAGPLYKETD